MNKKLLIAAGVGALVIVAQTAVSAAISPLERANETAAPVTSESRVEVASARAFAVSETPARIDSSALPAGNAPAPRTGEARVADRVAATPPSYNMALSAASQNSSTTCYYKSTKCGPGLGNSTTALVATAVGVGVIALVQDGGQSG